MLNSYTKFKKDEWDFLIILDACRFDYFSRLYKSFFDGILSEVYSLGSHTAEWFKNTFIDYYKDIIYISSNAYINSIRDIAGFDARIHFFKVVDVWRFGWNEKLGTVHPGTVNYITLSLKHKYPNKRFILHYLQPHAPYISKKFFAPARAHRVALHARARRGDPLARAKRFMRMNKHIPNVFRELERNIWYLTLREYLNLPSIAPIDAARRRFGIKGLRKAYAENLKIVLSYVASLVPKLTGSVVISSDHGEFLGENSTIGHFPFCYNPVLRIVPWFMVTNVKFISERE